jgi:hypothetical protein
MYVARYSLLTLVGGTLGLPVALVYLLRLAASSFAAGRPGVAFLATLGLAEGLVILFVWWSHPVVLRVTETSIVGRSIFGEETTWLRSTFGAVGEVSLMDHIAGTFAVRNDAGKHLFRVWSWLMHNGKHLEEDLRSSPKEGRQLTNE